MKSYLEGGDKDACQVSGLGGGLIRVDDGTINYDKKIRQRRRFGGMEVTHF